jgi:uncharacterized protein with gpF-like domain
MASTSRRRVVSPTGKDKTLTPVRPNAGIAANYRRQLVAMIDAMHKDLVAGLTAAYPVETPEMAADLSLASHMRIAAKRLARRWTRNFADLAPKLAEHFAKAACDRSDAALKQTLRDAGMTVQLKLTQAANNVVQASIHQNVSLIRSIASKHLADVEVLVSQSVAHGRDLGWLTEQLQDRYGITKRRAANIAIGSNNAATSAIQKARFEELGVTTARWRHSHAGRHPRPSHQAADGTDFDVTEGALIDGELIWPGTLPGCRCLMCPVIPGLRADTPKS